MKLSDIRPIFIGFLTRDLDFTYAQANAEWRLLTLTGQIMPRDFYVLRARRVGFYKPLTRADRIEVYMTLENAQNHAAFAAE